MNLHTDKYHTSLFLPVACLVFLLSFSGCVRLDEHVIPPGTPPTYFKPANDLTGKPLDALIVKAENTVSRIPMHTRLISDVSKQSRKAVVSIYTQTKTPYRIRLIPIPIPGMGFRVHIPGAGLGSGFFIHPSGYIITNDHVIDKAEEIKVMTHDDIDYDVSVVARDPELDLALLKVVNASGAFPVLPMGDSRRMEAGDIVIAVGNPLGLGHTITSGIISHMGRDLSGVPESEARQVEFIQTDAAINPGSSGGPLIALSGAWIGVNTAGTKNSQGIGFSVPSSQVKDFLEKILKHVQ